jgi:hypothetical protein
MEIKEMAKKENDTRIEAHLSPEDIKKFDAVAKEKDWSRKKLAENIIKDFLKMQKVKK